MNRLSYRENENGSFVSNLALLGADMLFVFIKPEVSTYEIRAIKPDNTVELLHKEECETVPKCKAAARKKLIDLGIVFQDEVRKKV